MGRKNLFGNCQILCDDLNRMPIYGYTIGKVDAYHRATASVEDEETAVRIQGNGADQTILETPQHRG